MAVARSFKYAVTPLQALVLIHHVVQSQDAENDAERTVEEIASEIDTCAGYLSKGIFESALYCCNIEAERENFWHPFGFSFDRFLEDIIPIGQKFNRYYNCVHDEKDE